MFPAIFISDKIYIYKERTPKTNLRGSQSGGYLLSHNIPQCSTIGDAVSLRYLPLSPAPAPVRAASATRIRDGTHSGSASLLRL